jgi:hypothetical protein
MAIKLVKVTVNLHALVKRVVDPNFTVRPPAESHGAQKVQKHVCHIEVDQNEWDWRWSKAIDVICGGSVDTTGTYYGDVIGGEWLIP